MTSPVLTIDGGSSSTKFAVFDRLEPPRLVIAGPVISPDGSPVTVREIPTDEEITIARQTLAVVGAPRGTTP